MASIIMDVTTRGLNEAIQNVRGAKDLITAGTAVRMANWYNSRFKKTALSIIESGEGMPSNRPAYARWKSDNWGIDHPLGVMTGMLYTGVIMSQPQVKETRGKEVRLAVVFKDPYYIAYVVDGTSKHVGRDFITLAKNKEWKALMDSVGTIFNNLDFTQPYPKLLSTVMGPNDLASLRSYG